MKNEEVIRNRILATRVPVKSLNECELLNLQWKSNVNVQTKSRRLSVYFEFF